MKRIAILGLVLVLVLSFASMGVAWGWGPQHPPKPPVLKVGPGQTYTTIGAALADAADGDTIMVYPSVYRESVVIDREVKLLGDGGPMRFCNGPMHVASRNQPVIELFDTYENSDEAPAVWVQTSNVEVRGFVIKGECPLEVFDPDGIQVQNVCIKDNVIIGLGARRNYSGGADGDPASSSRAFPGIFVLNADNVRVEDNEISGMTGAGIYLGLNYEGGDVTNSRIESNEITGTLYTGILVVRGSGNKLRRNYINGIGAGWTGDDGIRLGAAATGNTVERNEVWNCSRDGIRAHVNASGNTIQRNESHGNMGFDIYDKDAPPSDNTWKRNRYDTAGGSASG